MNNIKVKIGDKKICSRAIENMLWKVRECRLNLYGKVRPKTL